MVYIVTLPSIPAKIYHLFTEHAALLKIEKGNYIFREGERAENVYYITNGAIQINRETESGKELTMRICGQQSIIGESTLFCKLNFYTNTAKALETSTVYMLPVDLLELLLTENPPLLVEYLKWIQIENVKHQSRLRDLTLNGKKGALFSTLIRLANTYGVQRENDEIFIDLALTNTEIASLCATSREMINRMLNELKKLKIITFEKGYITILNLQFLKDEIQCENCPSNICRID